MPVNSSHRMSAARAVIATSWLLSSEVSVEAVHVPTLDAEQLLRFVAVEAGVAAKAVEVLAHRQGRLVARATLPSGTDVVVKVSAVADGFAAEAAAVQVLGAAGLPESQVRVVREGPPSVIVLDWTPGRAVQADDAVWVRREVVDILARIHSLAARAAYDGIPGSNGAIRTCSTSGNSNRPLTSAVNSQTKTQDPGGTS